MNQLIDLKCPFCKCVVVPLEFEKKACMVCSFGPCKAMGPVGKNRHEAIRKFKGLFNIKGVKK